MQAIEDIHRIGNYFTKGSTVFYFNKAALPGKNLRVFIYIRVSTKLQEYRFSLKAQIQELVQYAHSMGWIIVGIYRDVDSGGKLDKAGLTQMLDDVDDDKGDVVLCIDQDRLSRLDTVSWEYLKSQLRENSVKIAEPGKITDLADEDDEFFSDLKNLFAKREKKKIVKRMMRGKRQRTREGKGWGKPPFEYLYDKNTGKHTVNEAYSWVIPTIDDLYLKQGLSDEKIAEVLNGIKKPPSGKPWNSQHISKRLTSKAYHGVMEKSFSNGETIVTPGVYPPLRSKETWHRIQLKRKEKYQRRNPIYPALTRNIAVTCGDCGRKLSLKQSGSIKYGIHFYYKHGREHKPDYSPDCGMSINSIRIDFNLIRAVKEILDNEETARRYIQFEYNPQDIEQLNAEIEGVNKQLNEVQQMYDNLLDLVLKGGGGFSGGLLESKQAELESQRQVHTARKRQLENKKEAVMQQMFNYVAVSQYFEALLYLDEEMTPQEQMELIGRLFPSGVLYEDKLVLKAYLNGETPFPVVVPVAPNPFGYMNNGGPRKKRSTKASLGLKKITEEVKKQFL
ncbi:recombinase family protein [Paenibacillus naphthalenovorans]|uniref:Resolvase n=1 Tax=Paenibacillus naphthalenovorans TaxID=162209 RepID=A0A0U2MZX2_9BACL|nr:recombinase family protein [Paenibacillus naphthalenovorans]ALS24047.1 resolvase [Paenibacillus naphthalenovorans]SDJ75368.1 Site-specific DNA recombinase [Paenibacillus naphthalenovorans]